MRLVGQPGVGRKDQLRLQPADVLEQIAAHGEIVVLPRVGVAQPDLFLHADHLAGGSLVALQRQGRLCLGERGVEHAHQVVGHGQVSQPGARLAQQGQRPAGADVVVVIVRLDAQDAPGFEQVRGGQDRFEGHFYLSKFS